MVLHIDTSDREVIRLRIDEKEFKTAAQQDKSQLLLPFIVSSLKKEHKKINDVEEIEVVARNGSFTGLRVGVTVAMTLGWALKVPVNGKRIDKGETINIEY